jgi:thiol-disulfide isomerase/thioredoxin
MKTYFTLGFSAALIGILAWFFLSDSGLNRIQPLQVTDLNGQTYTLGTQQKVLVNFWATSCPSCIEEMPLLSQLQQNFAGNDFTVIAVAMSYDDKKLIRQFVAQRKLPFPVVFDKTGQIAHHFGDILLTPTNILLDDQGKVLYKKIGKPDPAKVAQHLN